MQHLAGTEFIDPFSGEIVFYTFYTPSPGGATLTHADPLRMLTCAHGSESNPTDFLHEVKRTSGKGTTFS